MDEEITDELLAGISDNLTKKIELFLVNNIADKEDQAEIIELLNEAFLEGNAKSLKSEMSKEHDEFMDEFNKKLLDGQDKPIPE